MANCDLCNDKLGMFNECFFLYDLKVCSSCKKHINELNENKYKGETVFNEAAKIFISEAKNRENAHKVVDNIKVYFEEETKKIHAEELEKKKAEEAENQRQLEEAKEEAQRKEQEAQREREQEELRQKLEQEEKQQYELMVKNLKSQGLDGYYEYKTLSLVDEKGGTINSDILSFSLNSLGKEGWRLVCAYSNEIGHNSTSGGIMGISAGTNSTIDQNILILERFVKIKE